MAMGILAFPLQHFLLSATPVWPAYLLFTRQLLLNKKNDVKYLLHFLPFAFLSLYLLMTSMYPLSHQWISFFYSRDTGLTIQILSLLFYHMLALQCWKHHKLSLKNHYSETQQLQASWIRQFIIVSLIVCTVIAAAIYLLYIHYPRGAEYRYGFAALTIFIYWVSYTALTQPSVFSVIKGQVKPEDTVIPFPPKLEIHRPVKKYSNSGLSQDEISAICIALQKVMEEQKPYLDSALTINDLAALVKCNRHSGIAFHRRSMTL